MRELVEILGVSIDKVSTATVMDRIKEFIAGSEAKTVFTPNSEIIMVAQNDSELKDVLNNSDLNLGDGIGVIYASRIIGKPLPERVTGFDTMQNLLRVGSDGSISFYLFGSKPGVAEDAKEKLKAQYPDINIVGTHNGYFNAEQEEAIIDEINLLRPDVLFVALGAPKQEKWIAANKNKLNVKVCMGVGGCFDIIAGNIKRAPTAYQKLGLEWFYRLLEEPSRWRRMLKLPQFGLTVVFRRITGRK